MELSGLAAKHVPIRLAPGRLGFDLIYLAAPYWHDDPAVRRARVECCTRMVNSLAFRGFFAYSPPTYGNACEMIAAPHPIGEPYWHEHSMGMLHHAQRLIVLGLPGWEVSTGIMRELREWYAWGMPTPLFVRPKFYATGRDRLSHFDATRTVAALLPRLDARPMMAATAKQ